MNTASTSEIWPEPMIVPGHRCAPLALIRMRHARHPDSADTGETHEQRTSQTRSGDSLVRVNGELCPRSRPVLGGRGEAADMSGLQAWIGDPWRCRSRLGASDIWILVAVSAEIGLEFPMRQSTSADRSRSFSEAQKFMIQSSSKTGRTGFEHIKWEDSMDAECTSCEG